jgi:hypothetical protein
MSADARNWAWATAGIAVACFFYVAAYQVNALGVALRQDTLTRANALLDNANAVAWNARPLGARADAILVESQPKIAELLNQYERGGQYFNRFLKGQHDEWFERQNVQSRKHALQWPDLLGEQLLVTLGKADAFIDHLDNRVNGEQGVLLAVRDGVNQLVKSGALPLDAAGKLLADPDWQATLKFIAQSAQNLEVSTAAMAAQSPGIAQDLKDTTANVRDISALVEKFLATQNKYGKLVLALRIIGALLPLTHVGR